MRQWSLALCRWSSKGCGGAVHRDSACSAVGVCPLEYLAVSRRQRILLRRGLAARRRVARGSRSLGVQSTAPSILPMLASSTQCTTSTCVVHLSPARGPFPYFERQKGKKMFKGGGDDLEEQYPPNCPIYQFSSCWKLHFIVKTAFHYHDGVISLHVGCSFVLVQV